MRSFQTKLILFFLCALIPAYSTHQDPVLTLYYSPTCPYCVKVLNYLHSIHKTVPMKNVKQSAEIKEELIEKGGKAEVPCLLIDHFALYSSDQIIEWLKTHQEELPSES